MIYLLLLAIVIFAVYNFLVIKLNGELPTSISASFYILNEWKNGWGYLFTVWCFFTAYLIIALFLELSDGQWFQFLGFTAAAGLAFVGAAPHFRTTETAIHYTAAGICCISALVWCSLMTSPVPSAIWLAGAVVAAFIRWYSALWFVEVAVFISTFLTLLALLLQ